MPPSSNAARRPRTWTGNEQGTAGKWIFVFWLGLALVISLGLFIYWMWPPQPTEIHYVSLAVDDYGDILPKPHYAVWQFGDIKKQQEEHGLDSWKEVKANKGEGDEQRLKSSIQGIDQLEEWLKDLGPALVRNEVQESDTLVLQLRMHAHAQSKQEDKFQLELLTGEQSETFGRFDAKLLLTALNDLPVRNVVVLADICDLDYAPQINGAVNPIASAFQSICEELKPSSGPAIWIVLAAGDYEQNHISHLRKRTLLQSACEFALASSSNETADTHDAKISLAEFYEQIWRYSRRATLTGGKSKALTRSGQTPVLLRVGQRELCAPNTRGTAWSAAEKVVVAHIGKTSTKPKEGDQAKAKEDAEKEKPQTADDKNKEKELELDAVLKYWERRDALLKPETTWPPALFAPHLWESHQELLAQLQFDLPRSESRIEDVLKELTQLDEAMGQPAMAARAQASQNQYLLRAFQSFVANPKLTTIRAPWENIELLPAADQRRWRPLREAYRVYAQSCSSIPSWARWSRYHDTELQYYSNFTNALIDMRSALPTENRAALDQTTSLQTQAIEQALSNLQASFQQLAQPLINKMQARQKGQMTWRDEWELQQLLESPLLDKSTRQTLWNAWRQLQVESLKYADEPNKESPIDYDQKVEAVVNQFPQNLNIWFDATSQLGQLVNADLSKTGIVDGASHSQWCAHFKDAVEAAKPAHAGAQDVELHRWHSLCLSALFKSQTDPTAAAGIVIPASLSRALVVTVANPLPNANLSSEPAVGFLSEKQTLLTLGVRRAGGTTVDQVKVTWKSTTAPLDRSQLSITTFDDMPLPPNTPTVLQVTNQTIKLKLNTEVDSRRFASPMNIELQVSEGTMEEVVRLNVIPRQPDIVELKAYRWEETKALSQEASGQYTTLKVMAIQGAKSRYQFKLNNLSSQPKRCIATLYALHDSEVSRDTGSPKVSPSTLEGRAPLAKSMPVSLPSAEVGRDQPQSLSLKLEPVTPGKPPITAIKNATANAQWLYFHIQELGPEDKPLKDKVHSGFCWLLARPPDKDLLTITRLPEAQFQLEIAPVSKAWSIFGHNDLKVQVNDYTRKKLLVDKPELIFTPKDNKPAIVQIKAEDDSTVNYYVQLSIGGYPRAVAYAAQRKANLQDVEPVSAASIKPESIRVTAKNRQDYTHTLDMEQFHDNLYVVPMRDQFGLIEYSGMSFEAEVDIPSSDFLPSFHLLDIRRAKTAAPIEFHSDRQFDFGFEFQESVALTAVAHDLKAEFSDTRLDGKLTLQTMIQQRSGTTPLPKGNAITLIFDSEAPKETEIKAVDKTATSRGVSVTRGEKLVLSLKPEDALSGIKKVQMAIDAPGKSPGKFDDEDDSKAFKVDINQKTGAWEFVLDAETTAKSSLRNLTVVACSTDKAGNVQNSHPPIKITLNQPVAKPKSDDQAK